MAITFEENTKKKKNIQKKKKETLMFPRGVTNNRPRVQ
jgi:hypothetical protein